MGTDGLSDTIHGVFGNRSESPFSAIRPRGEEDAPREDPFDYFRIEAIQRIRVFLPVVARSRGRTFFGKPGFASIGAP